MSQSQRVGGIIQLQQNGEIMSAKGHFSYNLGRPKITSVVGTDGKVHGTKSEGQPGFIEGAITDSADLDLDALVTGKGVTVTLSLANGKVIALNDGSYTGEGTPNTEEGEIPVRWESGDVEEIKP